MSKRVEWHGERRKRGCKPRKKACTLIVFLRWDRIGGRKHVADEDAVATLRVLHHHMGIIKEYYAIVSGRPESSGTMEDLLYHDKQKNKSYVVKRMRNGVKQASLDYRLLAWDNGLSLVKVRLHTGRTHQIRAQFASRAMPLAGDGKYGSKINSPLALWSCHLAFTHPVTGEKLSYSMLPSLQGPWLNFESYFKEENHG